MTVDVEAQIEIAQPRDVVGAYAADPDSATRCYANIRSAEWKCRSRSVSVRASPSSKACSAVSLSGLGRPLASDFRHPYP
jgi:hypothetical protein